MRGGHMPLNSEVLKHRFSKFWKKSVKVTTSMVNELYFEQNLNDFLELFSKKVQTSYSGRLRAPAVHGVSSIKQKTQKGFKNDFGCLLDTFCFQTHFLSFRTISKLFSRKKEGMKSKSKDNWWAPSKSWQKSWTRRRELSLITFNFYFRRWSVFRKRFSEWIG